MTTTELINHVQVDRGGPVDAARAAAAYEEQAEQVFIVLENPAVDDAHGVWNYEIDEWRVHPFVSRGSAVAAALLLNQTEASLYE